jgi:hypothetical protein
VKLFSSEEIQASQVAFSFSVIPLELYHSSHSCCTVISIGDHSDISETDISIFAGLLNSK